MDSPQTQIWGPHLWMILHSMAERIGQLHLKKFSHEETRLWTGLLSSLRYSLPCPLCKKHFSTFFSTNPIHISREFLRSWLYNCHNNVNLLNDKRETITIDEVQELYSKPFNFSHHFGIVMEHMTRAIRIGWCNRDDINRTVRFFQEMKRLYDLF